MNIEKMPANRFYLPLTYPGVSGFFHFGHFRGYTYTDVIVRYRRALGEKVVFPAGIHASGNLVFALLWKIRQRDPQLLKEFLEHGYSEDDFAQLTTVDAIITFFTNEYRKRWMSMNIDCDWNYYMTTNDEGYHRFIQWQFRHLLRKNLITCHGHVLPFCSNCGLIAIDSSETDIKQGSNAQRVQASLIFYQLTPQHRLVVSSTHPETVYAAEFIFFNQTIEYCSVMFEFDRSYRYIIARKCIPALSIQHPIYDIQSFDLKPFINEKIHDPITSRILILKEADHVFEHFGTGLVMGVPDIDVFDYRTCVLANPDYVVTPRILIDEKPFSPADIDIHLSFQELERKKKQTYQLFVNQGKFAQNMSVISGMSVRHAIQFIRKLILEKKHGLEFWYFSEPVICRCGSNVLLRSVNDQFFINYGEKYYVEQCKKAMENLQTYPASLKEDLRKTIFDWFGERACCREGNWIGTRFPGHPNLIIEPISDSTLYQAYYFVARAINEGRLQAESLTDEIFDEIFLQKDSSDPIIHGIQTEFQMMYPVSLIVCGKEHRTAHIPVCLFNHQVIFEGDQTKQPQAILVHEHVADRSGLKLSKSKGNAIPIPSILAHYPADVLRMFYVNIAEFSKEILWNPDELEQYQKRYCSLLEQATEIEYLIQSMTTVDSELRIFADSTFHKHLKNYHVAMENYRFREASTIALIHCSRDLRWLAQLNEAPSVDHLLSWCLMLQAFVPSLANEMWNRFRSVYRNKLVMIESPASRESPYVRDILILSKQLNEFRFENFFEYHSVIYQREQNLREIYKAITEFLQKNIVPPMVMLEVHLPPKYSPSIMKEEKMMLRLSKLVGQKILFTFRQEGQNILFRLKIKSSNSKPIVL